LGKGVLSVMPENCIRVLFLTQNEHKYIEAKDALSPFPNIEVEQLAEQKREMKDESLVDPIKMIAIYAAENASLKYNRIVIAEDSGIYFDAYDDFPAMNTKWIIKRIGYEGILKLLDGKKRGAYFRSVIALSMPERKTNTFEGIIKGQISEIVLGENVKCMDYDRIFIPAGFSIPFSLMMQEKKLLSHRSVAFNKLGNFLSSQRM
jgi:XTP/dITP diphosphohydrolase